MHKEYFRANHLRKAKMVEKFHQPADENGVVHFHELRSGGYDITVYGEKKEGWCLGSALSISLEPVPTADGFETKYENNPGDIRTMARFVWCA